MVKALRSKLSLSPKKILKKTVKLLRLHCFSVAGGSHGPAAALGCRCFLGGTLQAKQFRV